MATGILTGYTVLDLSQTLPGPYCTLLLADLGARVVKVERPDGGDPLRSLMPGMFAAFNRDKESVAVDLKHPEGQALLHRLAARADVVVESFRPGVAERLGAGHERLLQERPSLVYCSLSGYGQSGPNRLQPGHDLNYMAVAGLLGANAIDSQVPAEPPLPMADLAAGLFAAFAILAALLERSRHGSGRYIDVSMTDVVASWAPARMGEFIRSGELPPFSEREAPGHGVFLCADGRWVSVGAIEDHFWARLCALLADPVLLSAQHLPPAERAYQYATLRAALAACFRQAPADTWLRRLAAADVPAALVLNVAEAVQSPQAAARQLFFRLPAAEGSTLHAAFPVPLPGGLRTEHTPPPRPGAHTAALVAELGLPDGEYRRLQALGVVP